MTEQYESRWQGPKGETLGERAINGTTNAVLGWWERVGPKAVETQWVSAHQRVLDAIPDEDERKEAFRLTAERWRRIGGAMGAVGTGINFSLAGVGLWLSGRGLTAEYPDNIAYRVKRKTEQAAESADDVILWFVRLVNKNADRRAPLWNAVYDLDKRIFYDTAKSEDNNARRQLAGRLFSFIPGIGALGIAAGAGPAHAVGTLAARAAETREKRAFLPQRKR